MPRGNARLSRALILAIGGALALHASVLGAAEASADTQRPRIGLVLAGGGAKGVAHVGVLKVLEEMRVPVDYIVGTSMGSIVAGAYATGLTGVEMERRVRAADLPSILVDRPRDSRSQRSKDLERRNVLGVEIGVGKDGVKIPTGAIVGQNIELFLSELAGASADVGSFDELPVPYRAVATDIVTGEMVLLDRGDLISAMRASMAVPGVFSPVELNGRLLVDGGLVRNLPIDVVRKMGAEIVIAVNLSTTPRERKALNSAVGITQQMVDLLISANVHTSLSQITERDVLIDAHVGAFSSANFREATTLIPVGEKAARAAGEKLRALALSPEDYRAFRAAQVAREGRQIPVQSVRLDESSLGKVPAESARAMLGLRDIQALRREDVVEQFDVLLATDDFEQVRYRFVDLDDKRTLVLEPVAKSIGPNYMRFGLNLSSDLNGDSSFNILADHRATWLNKRGLEWRNSVSLGETLVFASELYQPLDLRRRFFLSPYLFWRQENAEIYVDEDSVARYLTRDLGAGLDFGINFGRAAELRLGYQWSNAHAEVDIGLPVFPAFEEKYGALRAQFLFDTLDDWAFPTQGLFSQVNLMAAREAFGGNLSFERAEARLDVPLRLGSRHRAAVNLRGGTSFGSELPFDQVFNLGGFLNLSGLQTRQILAERYFFGAAVYYYRLGAPGQFGENLYLGGSLEAASYKGRINSLTRSDDFIAGGSLFLALDSAVGPLYFAVGAADDGNYALYLFLGRP